jgi:hypothetical protein
VRCPFAAACPVAARPAGRRATRVVSLALGLALAMGFAARGASAAAPPVTWDAARGDAELAAIESRWKALASAGSRDRRALAELDARARTLSSAASRSLGAMREEAAERDADMVALIASPAWVAAEELLVKLRFRIAAIELERALAGDSDRTRLARAAADAFSDFVDAPDTTLAAEARYGRGLARLILGDRDAGLGDLRAAATVASVAPRARIATAEALAESGRRGEALDLVTRQLAAGHLSRDLELRAELLRLKLLVDAAAKSGARSGERADRPPLDEASALASDLLGAGPPWRSATLALLAGKEELLPAGAGADHELLRLRADALARRGDARGALAAYRLAVAAAPTPGDPVALEGLARAAVAAGAWAEAGDALDRLRATGRPGTRELAILELRAAYGLWRAAPAEASGRAVVRAADRLSSASGARPGERAEAAYRRAEVTRASGDLAGATAAFAAIDEPSWRIPARTSWLQTRALHHARNPAAEPRDDLLRDLAAWLARRDLPADARAAAIVLDATLRTEIPGAGRAPGVARTLDPAEQRAALRRLRDFPAAFPGSAALLPAVLRARALLEIELAEETGPAILEVLAPGQTSAAAAAIAGDLRELALAGAATADQASRARSRRALVAAVAFGALAPPRERSAERLELARAALDLGDPRLAERLYRSELAEKPASLSALRGVALAAEAAGDAAGARAAWDRVAARPDLPPALRVEVERHRAD